MTKIFSLLAFVGPFAGEVNSVKFNFLSLCATLWPEMQATRPALFSNHPKSLHWLMDKIATTLPVHFSKWGWGTSWSTWSQRTCPGLRPVTPHADEGKSNRCSRSLLLMRLASDNIHHNLKCRSSDPVMLLLIIYIRINVHTHTRTCTHAHTHTLRVNLNIS